MELFPHSEFSLFSFQRANFGSLNYNYFFVAVKEYFFVNFPPPAAATVFVTDTCFPVKHLFEFFFSGQTIQKSAISQALQAHNRKEKAKPLRLDSPGTANYPAPTVNQINVADLKSGASPFLKKVVRCQFRASGFKSQPDGRFDFIFICFCDKLADTPMTQFQSGFADN